MCIATTKARIAQASLALAAGHIRSSERVIVPVDDTGGTRDAAGATSSPHRGVRTSAADRTVSFVDIKVCAVSEKWSGLKLAVRKELRRKDAS
jgi:hypothetical protein